MNAAPRMQTQQKIKIEKETQKQRKREKNRNDATMHYDRMKIKKNRQSIT